MDPQLEKTPGLALPNPASEQGLASGIPNEAAFQPVESGQQPAPAMPPVMPPVTDDSVQQAASNVPVPGGPAYDATDSATANEGDNDALDQEWINKAKAVVEQTKHDPHLESAELSKVKAEYLRIRYNKQIKVSEDAK